MVVGNIQVDLYLAELIHKKKGYYLLALKGNQETIYNEAKELCAHYKPTSVENDCHWQLDITFNEDDTRKTGKTAENFSRLLRFCMNCVRAVVFGKDNKESVKTEAFILANSKNLLMQLSLVNRHSYQLPMLKLFLLCS